MISKLPAIAIMLFGCSYAVAGSNAIGTVSARGDIRIDGDSVKGNATLFDGTVVETEQATAALRLARGVEIKLATGSRSTLYRDRIVLQRGASEFAPSSLFSLEANSIRVRPNEPNSRALVSMTGPNTVEVADLAGGFQVTDDRGLLLAHLSTGRTMSFAMQAETNASGKITVTGQIRKEGGHYFLIEDTRNLRYELKGKGFFWLESQEVTIIGTVDPHATPVEGAVAVVDVSETKKVAVAGAGIANGPSWVIVGSIAAAGVAIGLGIAESSGPSTPASR